MGKSPQPALRKGSAFKEVTCEITPGRPAIIHRNDQVPGLDWQTSPVVRIISMAIMGGRLGVKFETYNTVYTVVQDLF